MRHLGRSLAPTALISDGHAHATPYLARLGIVAAPSGSCTRSPSRLTISL